MDAATSRTLRIGTTNIGLIGLDSALNRALADDLEEAEAMEFLYQEIKNKNYIPPKMEEPYRLALFKTYAQLRQGTDNEQEGLVIRIFGTGCVSCNSLQNLVIEILAEMQIGADIEQIHDPDEIGRAGVLQTPALMINGQLKQSGLLPTRAMIEQWIREFHD